MARIVCTGKIPQEAVEAMAAEHEVVTWDTLDPIERGEMLSRVKGADALVTLLTEKIDGELLDAAGEQLQVVANVAVGYNNIDVAACEERNVIATNTPKVLTEATADTAFALLLNVTRRFGEGERVIRSKTPWSWGMFYMLGTGIQGKTIGIIGMGQIGIAMARRAKAFGMDVIYSGPSRIDEATESELGAKHVSMDELLAQSDVISLHCPYSDSTHHLFGADQFAAMKDSAFIINSARGPIIDEEALVEALDAKQIAGAGLDVFENEPAVHEGLLGRDDVYLLPHLGSATVETRTAMAMLAAENVLNVLGGKDAATPVTASK